MAQQIEDYNSEPVKYCSQCYSLKILYEESIDFEYCATCGCSDILETSIEEWEKLYSERYGHKYVVKNPNQKLTFLSKCTEKELMRLLVHNDSWREIVYRLYPDFYRGYSRVDTLMLLFDRVRKDGRFDDLRNIMTEYI